MPLFTQKLLTVGKVGLAGVVVAGMASCGEGPAKPMSAGSNSVGRTQSDDDPTLALMDPKDDVVGDGAKARASSGTASGTSGSTAAKKPTPPAATSATGKKGRWSVILATFADGDHAAKAAAFRSQLVAEYPELREAQVRRVGKGSALVIGRFEAPDDPAAKSELKRVKSIERNKQKPFAGAMLMRTTADDVSGPPKARDLRSLRAKYPSVRPMFTLQVAAWSTFGEKGADYDKMRLEAERFCEDLRTKGHESWFLHDEDTETSIVSVGHFDRRAYDPKSTLFSDEVTDLMRQFPSNQVNGEPLLIPIDPKNPKGKTRPQPCRLVEVPGL